MGGTPSAPTEVIQGMVERIVYANDANGWSVVRLQVPGKRDLVTAVGNLLGAQAGEQLRLTGHWGIDPKYGAQFRADGFTTLKPSTVAGIEKYLGSGLVRGMGPRMAARLVRAFGLETLDVIELHPERLTEVEGIGPVRAKRLQDAWQEQKAIREIMIFLEGHGVSPALAVRIFRRYGQTAVATVQENPYRLADEIRGIGFRTADRIAQALQIAADAPARIAAGVVYALHQWADQGHTYCPSDALIRLATKLLNDALAGRGDAGPEVTPEGVADQIAALVTQGDLERDTSPEGPVLLLPALASAERGVTGELLRLVRHQIDHLSFDVSAAIAWYEKQAGIVLAPAQREAIRACLHEKCVVITGGPGTGKTTLVRGTVEIASRKGLRIMLCAPTGRAAQRMEEATGREAKTIHRLLEIDPASGRFVRDHDNPLPTDLLIADEVSMLDTLLMYSLLRALPSTARFILVGDADQLPSVGPGNVLRDIIDSGVVPVVALTEIFRQQQSSRIIVNAHRINHGRMPESARAERSDFYWIRKGEPEDILETVRSLVTERLPSYFGMNRAEIQVLTPMRRGTLGSAHLNNVLQEALNPTALQVRRGTTAFRVGDRVMQLHNDYDKDVFNGDIGWIERMDEERNELILRFGKRTVAYDARDLDDLDLAYACSIHKSQGSEFPCVVIPLHTQHYVMLRRNLLYTAVTRGKRLVVLIASERALGMALKGMPTPRQTLLATRLRQAQTGTMERE